jgi:hypothetical protein
LDRVIARRNDEAILNPYYRLNFNIPLYYISNQLKIIF